MDKQDKDLRIVHDYIRGIPLTDYKDALAALNRADKRIAALESDNARLQQRADAAEGLKRLGHNLIQFCWHVGACASFTGGTCDCGYEDAVNEWTIQTDTT
jgi:hypothetical protein